MTTEENMTLLLAIVTGAKWVYEYSERMKWEKNRFLLERIEEFRKKEEVQNMQTILDWNAIQIEIDGKLKFVNDKILFESLQTHDTKNSFTELEVSLRKLFDKYFDSLNDLLIMQKAGLYSEKRLRIFLEYWINILNGKAKSKSSRIIKQIDKYLMFYGYKDLREFLYK